MDKSDILLQNKQDESNKGNKKEENDNICPGKNTGITVEVDPSINSPDILESPYSTSAKSLHSDYRDNLNNSEYDSHSREFRNLFEETTNSSHSSEAIYSKSDENLKSFHNYSEETSQSLYSNSEDILNINFNNHDNGEIRVSEDSQSRSLEAVKEFFLSAVSDSENASEEDTIMLTVSENSFPNIDMEMASQSIPTREESFDAVKNTEIFSWDDYLLRMDAEAVPSTALPHIEDSLATGVEIGQYAELLRFSESEQKTSFGEEQAYWIVEVVSVHDTLLRLKYVNIETEITPHFWCSLLDQRLRPLGHNKDSLPFLPPITAGLSAEETSILVESMVYPFTPKRIPDEALCEKTIKYYCRIQEGILVEVTSLYNPFCGWVAKVQKNIGGRLQLVYLSPITNNTDVTVWLFCSDKRIKPIGWIQDSGDDYTYQPPCELQLDNEALPLDWIQNLRMESPHWPTCFDMPAVMPKHNVSVGARFEYVNPNNKGEINEVAVSEIHDEYYFSVSCTEFQMVTSFHDWSLLPASFCSSNSISLTPLHDVHPMECPSKAGDNLKELTEQRRASSCLFATNMKLEAVHPCDRDFICVATIIKKISHLIWLKFDSDPNLPPVIRTLRSTDIFTAEWASEHNHPFIAPKFKRKKTEETHTKAEDAKEIEEKLTWCPAIYVKPWCTTGPLINKKKLAHVPQNVGPGPLKLVLLRVLTYFFNSGYRPTLVLTAVDSVLEKKRYWPELHVKARYKQRIVRATISIPPYVSMVKKFLTEVCEILDCCPDLWSFQLSEERCIFGCPGKISYIKNIHRSADLKMSSKRSLKGKILLCSDQQNERSSVEDDEAAELDRESPDSSDGSDSSQPTTPFMDVARSPSPLSREARDEDIRRKIAALDPSGLGVWDVETDPARWSVETLGRYLSTQPGIGHLVPLLRSQDFDGASFMLLDLPSILNDLNIPYNSGIKLAHCVFRLKLACLIFDKDELR